LFLNEFDEAKLCRQIPPSLKPSKELLNDKSFLRKPCNFLRNEIIPEKITYRSVSYRETMIYKLFPSEKCLFEKFIDLYCSLISAI